jgi:GT2 family glycosyltransferase
MKQVSRPASADAATLESSADGYAPITLAVPYYSGFALFRHTLRSLAAQTYPACRVLVCDDSPAGLSEGERAEIASIVGIAYPLRIVRNEQNLGMARTWNRCLDEADTDLVTIVHNDDELADDYAFQMAALASQHPDATAVFCGASIIGEAGQGKFSFPDLYKQVLIPRHERVLELSGDRALHSLMRGNYIFCPTLCYRRSRLGSMRFDPRYRMVLDMDLTTRIVLAGQRLVGVPKQALYRYRRHDDNATQHLTKELTRFTEESAFYLDVAKRAELVGFVQAARTAARRSIVKLNLVFCIVRDLRTRQWQDGGRKLRLLAEMVQLDLRQA